MVVKGEDEIRGKGVDSAKRGTEHCSNKESREDRQTDRRSDSDRAAK